MPCKTIWWAAPRKAQSRVRPHEAIARLAVGAADRRGPRLKAAAASAPSHSWSPRRFALRSRYLQTLASICLPTPCALGCESAPVSRARETPRWSNHARPSRPPSRPAAYPLGHDSSHRLRRKRRRPWSSHPRQANDSSARAGPKQRQEVRRTREPWRALLHTPRYTAKRFLPQPRGKLRAWLFVCQVNSSQRPRLGSDR